MEENRDISSEEGELERAVRNLQVQTPSDVSEVKENESDQTESKMTNVAVEAVDPTIEVQNLSGKLLDQEYAIQIWQMDKSLYIWIGTDHTNPVMGNMCVAMPTRFDATPLVSEIQGGLHLSVQQIAQRIAKRTNQQIFLSCSLPDQPALLAYVEKKLINHLLAP